jgi:hypothetical protein
MIPRTSIVTTARTPSTIPAIAPPLSRNGTGAPGERGGREGETDSPPAPLTTVDLGVVKEAVGRGQAAVSRVANESAVVAVLQSLVGPCHAHHTAQPEWPQAVVLRIAAEVGEREKERQKQNP